MSRTRANGPARGLLRKHDYRQLLAGFAVSSVGDWLYSVALLVFVYDQTGSAAWVGATTIARLAPYILFGPLAGVVADRYEKRRVMVITDIARAALMFALATLALMNAPAVFALAIAFLATAAGTPEGPALTSLLPKVCDDDELATANSLMSAVDNVALVVGPAIGALLLLLGSPAAAFAVNGVTFVVAALFASRVETRSRPEGTGDAEPGMREQIAEGMAAIRASGSASLLVALLAAAAGLYGFELVFVVLLAEGPLDMGSQGVGWLTAAVGAGGVASAVVADRLANSRKADVTLLAAVGLVGLPFVALAVTSAPGVALLLMGFIGAGSILFDVVGVTILQRVVQENLLGRVFGILDSLGVAAMLLGSIIAPMMVRQIGLRSSLVVVGATLPACCLLAVPKLRSLRKEANDTMDALGPIVTLLERCGAFEGATPQALEQIAAAMQKQEVSEGVVIVREGEKATDFFVIASGRFEVTFTGSSGTAVGVNELSAGDYFGEIGLLKGLSRTATVTATEAGVLYRIPGPTFVETIQQASVPPVRLITSMSRRLKRTHPTLEPPVAGALDA